MNIEKLRAVRTIVTHDNCPDGVASAMILRDVLPDARVIFARYGSPEIEALPAEPGMLFVDFSPPAARVAEFVEAQALCLDHHKTAKDVVAAFGDNGRFGDEAADPGVCGAVLAYRCVWKVLRGHHGCEAIVSEFAELAGIRDTWQRQHPQWEVACAQAEALTFWPRERLLRAVPNEWPEMLAIGGVLLVKKEEAVRRSIRDAQRTTIAGARVVIIPTVETSDVMEALVGETDIVAGFAFRCEPDGVEKMQVSLRSRDLDVSAIAKQYGGGGHTRAAGFTVCAMPKGPYDTLGELLGTALGGGA